MIVISNFRIKAKWKQISSAAYSAMKSHFLPDCVSCNSKFLQSSINVVSIEQNAGHTVVCSGALLAFCNWPGLWCSDWLVTDQFVRHKMFNSWVLLAIPSTWKTEIIYVSFLLRQGIHKSHSQSFSLEAVQYKLENRLRKRCKDVFTWEQSSIFLQK